MFRLLVQRQVFHCLPHPCLLHFLFFGFCQSNIKPVLSTFNFVSEIWNLWFRGGPFWRWKRNRVASTITPPRPTAERGKRTICHYSTLWHVAQNSLLCWAILIHLTSNICDCSYQLHLTTLVGLPLAISPHLQPLSTSPIFQPLEDWKIGRLERRREAAASTPPLASTTPGRSAFLLNNSCCRPSAKTPHFSHSSCTLHSTAKGNS